MGIKKIKPGFVIFHGRSGSTLLCKKLHQYSDVYISPESSFASRVLGTDIFKYSSGKELIEFSCQYQ